MSRQAETTTIPPEKYPKRMANGMGMEDVRQFVEVAGICRREALKETGNTISFNALIGRSLYEITCTFEWEHGLSKVTATPIDINPRDKTLPEVLALVRDGVILRKDER